MLVTRVGGSIISSSMVAGEAVKITLSYSEKSSLGSLICMRSRL